MGSIKCNESLTWHHIFYKLFKCVGVVIIRTYYSCTGVYWILYILVNCTQCAFTAEQSMVASKHISLNQKPQIALFFY